MTYAPHLLGKIQSDALLSAIRGMPCTLRISTFVPGHSCAPASTVVPCHISAGGKGMATKETDLMAVAGCLHCHDLLDRRDSRWIYLEERYPAAVLQRCLHAVRETQAMLVQRGIITVKGARDLKVLGVQETAYRAE